MKNRIISVVLVFVVSVICVLLFNEFNIVKEENVNNNEISLMISEEKSTGNEIIPGWTSERKFSLINNSENVYSYNIVFGNLINTFVTEGCLQYKITSINGYNMEEYESIPKSDEEKDVILKYDVEIGAGVTEEYTVEFRYIGTLEDQNTDNGKVFSGGINIVEGTVDPNIFYSVTLNVENAQVTDENPKKVNKKGTAVFNVEANEGYTLGSNVVCDNAIGKIENGIVTISNVIADTTCILTSETIIHNVEIEVSNGVSNALNRLVNHGSDAEFTITADTGYTMSGASVSEGCVIEGNTVISKNVTEDRKCVVILVKNKYNVYLNGDNITVASPKEVEYLESAVFDIVVNAGSELSNEITCDDEKVTKELNGTQVIIGNITKETRCIIGTNVNTYKVEIEVSNGVSNALNRIVNYGSDAEFTITADTGYTMTGATVTGKGCTIEGNTVISSNVTENRKCVVSLSKEKYSVSLSGSGVTVSGSPKEVEYLGNTTFNVTASAEYTLENSSLNCNQGAKISLSGNVVTISNITGNTVCTIEPKQKTYSVTLNVVNGSGSTSKTITHGSSGTFSIGANTGYNLTSPTMECTGSAGISISGSSVTVSNVTGEQTCTVTLKINKYTVNVNVTGGSSSPSSASISYGSSGTFTISASSGRDLSEASVSGTGCSLSGSKLTASNVTSTRTCSVSIPYYYYSVSAPSVSGGSYSPTGTRTVEWGDPVSWTITANTGYDLSNATVSGTNCSLSGSTLKKSSIKSSGSSCTVNIPKKTYTVSVSVSGGSASPSSISVNHGGSGTSTISASTGYNLSGATVSGAGCSLSSDKKTLTVSDVTSAMTCTVTIPELPKYTVSVNVTGGTSSPSSKTLSKGSTAAFNITADDGYTLDGATVSGGCTLSGNTLKATNLSSNMTCTVDIPKITYKLTFTSTGYYDVNTYSFTDSDPLSCGGTAYLDYGESESYYFYLDSNKNIGKAGSYISNESVKCEGDYTSISMAKDSCSYGYCSRYIRISGVKSDIKCEYKRNSPVLSECYFGTSSYNCWGSDCDE